MFSVWGPFATFNWVFELEIFTQPNKFLQKSRQHLLENEKGPSRKQFTKRRKRSPPMEKGSCLVYNLFSNKKKFSQYFTLSLTQDIADRLTNMVLLYSITSQRYREGLWLCLGKVIHSTKKNHHWKKNSSPSPLSPPKQLCFTFHFKTKIVNMLSVFKWCLTIYKF